MNKVHFVLMVRRLIEIRILTIGVSNLHLHINAINCLVMITLSDE